MYHTRRFSENSFFDRQTNGSAEPNRHGICFESLWHGSAAHQYGDTGRSVGASGGSNDVGTQGAASHNRDMAVFTLAKGGSCMRHPSRVRSSPLNSCEEGP